MHAIYILHNMSAIYSYSFPIEYIASIYYNSYCQGGNPETNKSRPLHRAAERRQGMKRIKGTWFYQGTAYQSFHEALRAAWPK